MTGSNMILPLSECSARHVGLPTFRASLQREGQVGVVFILLIFLASFKLNRTEQNFIVLRSDRNIKTWLHIHVFNDVFF